jgi:hypothetical protein
MARLKKREKRRILTFSLFFSLLFGLHGTDAPFLFLPSFHAANYHTTTDMHACGGNTGTSVERFVLFFFYSVAAAPGFGARG